MICDLYLPHRGKTVTNPCNKMFVFASISCVNTGVTTWYFYCVSKTVCDLLHVGFGQKIPWRRGKVNYNCCRSLWICKQFWPVVGPELALQVHFLRADKIDINACDSAINNLSGCHRFRGKKVALRRYAVAWSSPVVSSVNVSSSERRWDCFVSIRSS